MRLPSLLVVAVLLAPTAHAQFPQLGGDIDGEAAGDWSGLSVSLDGDRLAIGSPLNDGTGTDAGVTRVYEWDGSAWSPLGRGIDGEAAEDYSGWHVSLSGDRLAIGAPRNGGNGTNAGHARVFEWDGAAWAQLGSDIDGDAASSWSGMVSLDGDRLAVGATAGDLYGPNSGHTRVYEWDGTAWRQLGADIAGEAPGDQSGYAVSLDGDRLAIGAPLSDSSTGYTQVYQWTGTAWDQLGGDLDGEATGDQFGQSVSLDGDRLAIGARFHDAHGVLSGHSRVYEWMGAAWVQLGAGLAGGAPLDGFGRSLSLSGDRLAIGATGGDLTGHTRVYEWDGSAWVRLGAGLAGEAAHDGFGHSVSLDGDRLAVGAPDNDGNGSNAGHTRVYSGFAPAVSAEDEPSVGTVSLLRPNPTSSRAEVLVVPAEAGVVRAVAFDALGRAVAVLHEGLVAGPVRLALDASPLAPGVYVVRVAGPGVTRTRLLTVVR